MKTNKGITIIKLRDLYRNAAEIAKRVEAGEHFEVFKHSTPVMHIGPSKFANAGEQEKSAFETFGDIVFSELKDGKKSGKLSQSIDKLLYEK